MKREIISFDKPFNAKIGKVKFTNEGLYDRICELLDAIENRFGDCYNEKFVQDLKTAFSRAKRGNKYLDYDVLLDYLISDIEEANMFENIKFYSIEDRDYFEKLNTNMSKSLYDNEIERKGSYSKFKNKVILDLVREDGDRRVEVAFKLMRGYISASVEHNPCEDFLTEQESSYYYLLNDDSREAYDYAVTSVFARKALNMTVSEFYTAYNNSTILSKILNRKLTGIERVAIKPNFKEVGKIIFGSKFKGVSKDHPFVGGIQRFENLTVEKYKKLVSLGALRDRHKSFNYAPSSNELSEIAEREPNSLRLAGYMNSDKNDSQVYISAIHSRDSIDDLIYFETKREIEGLKKLADRYETDPIYIFFD